jgi:hypothetical protein
MKWPNRRRLGTARVERHRVVGAARAPGYSGAEPCDARQRDPRCGRRLAMCASSSRCSLDHVVVLDEGHLGPAYGARRRTGGPRRHKRLPRMGGLHGRYVVRGRLSARMNCENTQAVDAERISDTGTFRPRSESGNPDDRSTRKLGATEGGARRARLLESLRKGANRVLGHYGLRRRSGECARFVCWEWSG